MSNLPKILKTKTPPRWPKGTPRTVKWKYWQMAVLFVAFFLLSAIFASPILAQYYQPGESDTCQASCANIEEQCSEAACRHCSACAEWSKSFGLTPARWFEPSAEEYETILQQSGETGDVSVDPWSYRLLHTTALGLTREILGPLPTGTQAQSYRPGGAIGGMTNLIAAMYANPPASSVDYLADLGRNLEIVKPAYAQAGVGFRGLQPILPIWKAFRNIAYLFFTIVFVVIGFAIMFRIKLGPQTVISLQNAIPRIIIALILVTFSYAIAGLLIDLMYVALNIGIAILGGIPPLDPKDIPALQEQFTTGGFSQLIGAAFKATGKLQFLGLLGLGALIGAAVGAITGSLVGLAIGALTGGGLILLLLSVVVLYCLFKLFLELLKTYLSIILSIIFAPLQIMLEAIPGVQIGFGSWLRTLVANLAVFPAVALVLLLARILINRMTSEEGLWAPPGAGMAGLAEHVAPTIIALGFLFIVHKVPQMVKEALGLKPFPYGAAIGEALRPVTAPAGWVWGGVTREMQERIGMAAPEAVGGGWAAARERLRTGRRLPPQAPTTTT